MKSRTKVKTRRAWLALVGVIAVASLVATACGSDRDDDDATPDPTTTAAPASEATAAPTTMADTAEQSAGGAETTMAPTTAAPEPAVPMFGNKPWPCGPGDASGETWQGVDDDSITIGIGDDRGFPDSPGLNADQTAAVINFIDRCNELGGINGRQIEYNNYDAAIFNAGAIMQEACDQVFMLVGNGFSLDQFTEQTRVGCGLGAVPAWTVSVDFAHGPWQVNAVPNPGDQTPMSMAVHAAQIAEARGYDITKAGAMYGDFSATQETWLKVQDTYPAYGYEFIEALEYATGGEDDWTPFIQQLKDSGVEVMYFTGSCPNHYQAVRETAALNDFDAIWFTDANFYVTSCANVNDSGSLDQTFIRMVFFPFEEAETNPPTQDFIDILDEAGNNNKSLLGMQAVSSFLLWATGAAACGSNLTRDCVIDELKQITEWDGHGLHVVTNPAGNIAPTCGLLMELVGTEYTRALPTDSQFDCNPDWAETVGIPAVEAAQLDENRISQKYLAS